MDKIVEQMAEYVCDNICQYPKSEPEELEEICTECKLAEYICSILNKYKEAKGSVIECSECEYYFEDSDCQDGLMDEMGHYKTKERCLEVMQDIVKALHLKNVVYEMPKK